MTQGEARRAALMTIVRQEPGCTLRRLMARSNLAAGVCSYHVSMLAREGSLVRGRDGFRVRHYPQGYRVPSEREIRVHHDAACQKLRQWLHHVPGPVPQRVILDHAAETWEWPRSTTQWRLQRLVQADQIQATPAGRFLYYSVPAPPTLPLAARIPICEEAYA
jgi:hypothetical protein